jgi:hypothetical protein
MRNKQKRTNNFSNVMDAESMLSSATRSHHRSSPRRPAQSMHINPYQNLAMPPALSVPSMNQGGLPYQQQLNYPSHQPWNQSFQPANFQHTQNFPQPINYPAPYGQILPWAGIVVTVSYFDRRFNNFIFLVGFNLNSAPNHMMGPNHQSSATPNVSEPQYRYRPIQFNGSAQNQQQQQHQYPSYYQTNNNQQNNNFL